MQFRCEREVLGEAIGHAQRARLSRTGAIPALSGVLVRAREGSLQLTGSDLEITIRVEVAAECGSEGEAVFPGRVFGDVVRSLEPGAVSVEVVDGEARVRSGRSRFSLRVLDGEEFPRLLARPEGEVRIPGPALVEALAQVVPAASREESRPVLTGVLLVAREAGLRLVATDSYRLAVRDMPGVALLAQGQQVLVPAKALGEVQRLIGEGEVAVSFSDREASFVTGRASVSARLLEGQFPNYEQLVPTGYPNRLVVSRDLLVDAVKRVRLVTQGREGTPVRLSMSAEGLELFAVDSDVGEAHETVEAKYEGNDMTVAFNPDFLLDGLSAIGSDEAVIESLEVSKPAIVRAPEARDFLYLLMPVRV